MAWKRRVGRVCSGCRRYYRRGPAFLDGDRAEFERRVEQALVEDVAARPWSFAGHGRDEVGGGGGALPTRQRNGGRLIRRRRSSFIVWRPTGETLLSTGQGMPDCFITIWAIPGSSPGHLDARGTHYRRAGPWPPGDFLWRQALVHVRNERVDAFPLSAGALHARLAPGLLLALWM